MQRLAAATVDPTDNKTCCVCGDRAVVTRLYEDMCQFHWDCQWHELKIILDAIRDFGPYGRETGPQFGCTFYGWLHGDPEKRPKYAKAGYSTLGYGLHVSMYPNEAMNEALRIAKRNNWILLRLDVQAGASHRLRLRTCTDIFVSEKFQKYMNYSEKISLPYDAAKYGELNVAG